MIKLFLTLLSLLFISLGSSQRYKIAFINIKAIGILNIEWTTLLVGSPLIYCQRAAPSHAQSLLSTCYRYARLTLSTPALSRVIPNITRPAYTSAHMTTYLYSLWLQQLLIEQRLLHLKESHFVVHTATSMDTVHSKSKSVILIQSDLFG